jgi:hypothetical protein
MAVKPVPRKQTGKADMILIGDEVKKPGENVQFDESFRT